VAGTTRDKEATVWKVHLRAGGGGGDKEKWYLIQDLMLEETRKEMIFLGETVLQARNLVDDISNEELMKILFVDMGKAT
jgi:U4/U6.U5 tri-snRNP-associated protein 2